MQAPFHDIAFTYGRTISITMDDEQRQEYNTEDNDEQHYYYEYIVPRQLVYILTGQ